MALVSRNSGGDEDAIFMASRSQDSCPSPGQGSSPQIQYPQRQSSNKTGAFRVTTNAMAQLYKDTAKRYVCVQKGHRYDIDPSI